MGHGSEDDMSSEPTEVKTRRKKQNEKKEKNEKSPRKRRRLLTSEDSEWSGFRDASTSHKKDAQVTLREHSQKHPGWLTSRLLLKMQHLLAREGGVDLKLQAKDPAAPVAVACVLTIVAQEHKGNSSLTASEDRCGRRAYQAAHAGRQPPHR